MRLNDVMGLLKSDEIIDKTITITVDEDGAVVEFSLRDREEKSNAFNPQTLPKLFSDSTKPNLLEPPYKITCSEE